MSLFVIGDTHLSFGVQKPMDIFAGWENHTELLRDAWCRLIHPEDTVVLAGDISWGMSMEEALPDFQWLDALPGKEKIILKGNHDYWWTTAGKAKRFFAARGIDSIEILHNTCFFYGDTAICGTRGWFYEEERGGEHDKKIMLREVGRLETSLNAAGEREKIVFLHYPPIYQNYRCAEILALFRAYGVRRCYYGHLHGKSITWAFNGELEGTAYRLISADAVAFKPQLVLN
jgi:predicted phosphohydrolase